MLPIEELTNFKPFNVRETNFDVIDTAQASQEQHIRAFDQMGRLDKRTSARSTSQYSNVNHLPVHHPSQSQNIPPHQNYSNNLAVPNQQTNMSGLNVNASRGNNQMPAGGINSNIQLRGR